MSVPLLIAQLREKFQQMSLREQFLVLAGMVVDSVLIAMMTVP